MVDGGFLWKASRPSSKKYCCIDRAKSEKRKESCRDGGRCRCTKRSQTEYEEIPITSKRASYFAGSLLMTMRWKIGEGDVE